jgi:hypothetical protein
MKPLLAILQGALGAGAGVLACGWIALALARPKLKGIERWVAALALGAPLYSAVAAALLLAGVARRGILTALPVLLAAAAWRLSRRVPREADPPAAARPWTAAAAVVLAPFAVVALLSALAPDLTPAGEDAALGQAARLSADPSAIAPWLWHAAAPLWLSAFSAGRHSAVSALHLLFFAGAAALVYSALHRTAHPPAAWCGAVLTFTCPALLVYGTGAGHAVLSAFLASAAVFLAVLGAVTRQRALALAALLPAAHAVLLAPAPGSAYAGFLFRPLGALPAAIPLAAFALAWFMRGHWAWLAAVTLFCAAVSWPPHLRRLAPAGARVLPGVSLSVVLRRVPEETYLQQRSNDYRTVREFRDLLPFGAKVLADAPLLESRFGRTIETHPRLLGLLHLPLDPHREPRFLKTVKASAVSVRAFRLNARGAAEIRFYLAGREAPRTAAWRVSAPEAFDNNPATMVSGRVDAGFGGPVSFDEIRILGTEGEPAPRPPGLRRYAALALRRAGVTHVAVRTGDALCTDLRRHGEYWGVRELAAGGIGGHATALFEIR